MRLNKYIATYSNLSRRKADAAIESGNVIVNRKNAHVGMNVSDEDAVIVYGSKILPIKRKATTVILNKPEGYVCSKNGQGSPTVYDLLQPGMQDLNIAGRLDKDSSGLVVMTNDGQLLQELSHPSYNKEKVYEVALNSKPSAHLLSEVRNTGVDIGDGRPSKMKIVPLKPKKFDRMSTSFTVTLTEGRNRQIRRTFESLKFKVLKLHRIALGPYELNDLKPEQFKEL